MCETDYLYASACEMKGKVYLRVGYGECMCAFECICLCESEDRQARSGLCWPRRRRERKRGGGRSRQRRRKRNGKSDGQTTEKTDAQTRHKYNTVNIGEKRRVFQREGKKDQKGVSKVY